MRRNASRRRAVAVGTILLAAAAILSLSAGI